MSTTSPGRASPSLSAVPNHNGQARDDADVFFALPPPAIGELLSASTSVNRRHRGDAAWFLRVCFALAISACVAAAAATFDDGGGSWSELPPPVWAVMALAFACTLWLTGDDEVCSFVGTEGFALARRWLGMFPGRASLRPFRAATRLRVAYTRVFRGDDYRGTSFAFEWLDRQGQVVFALRGDFREYRVDLDELDIDAIAALPVHHRFYAARAAAIAWRLSHAASPVQDDDLPIISARIPMA